MKITICIDRKNNRHTEDEKIACQTMYKQNDTIIKNLKLVEENLLEKLRNDNISFLLTEYSVIKSEQTTCEQSQVTIATALFSFIAAILGFNFFGTNMGLISEEASKVLLLGFCLILVMFFGCLWMHQLYCQMRFGAYIYHLEKDISEFCTDSKMQIYFEHWIINQEKGRFWLFKTSWIYGFVTFGTWILSPVLLGFFVAEIFPEWNVLEFYFFSGPIRAGFFGGISVIYYFVQIKYLIEILTIKGKKKLMEPRIQGE